MTLTIPPGYVNYDILERSIFDTSRTIVNTATHTLSSTYLVGSEFANNVASITVTPTLHDPAASVLVNGTAVVSGGASPAIPLAVGNNVITVIVTAEDGATTATYTITITRMVALSIAFVGNGGGMVTTAPLPTRPSTASKVPPADVPWNIRLPQP